jgi:hypothetical protein
MAAWLLDTLQQISLEDIHSIGVLVVGQPMQQINSREVHMHADMLHLSTHLLV